MVSPASGWWCEALGRPSLGLFRFLKDSVSKRGPRQFLHDEKTLVLWIVVEPADQWRPIAELFTGAEQAFSFGLKLSIVEELILRLGAHRAAGRLI